MDRRAFLLGAGPALAVTPAVARDVIPAVPAIHREPVHTPQLRIEKAMAEIRAALAELYPGHYSSGQASLWKGKGFVVLGAYPLHGYEARAHFSDDPPGWSPAAEYQGAREKPAISSA
ncbi:hypothetical protein [Ancylobacter sp. G4_0304]|uniref:hypothetical protein n=1 Tax=Ancylobacter sp. G4_0304 TaxID=3114289 RepID=UPI0039C5C987